MYKSGLHSAVHVTVPSIELAKTLAQGILKHDLASCVDIIPSFTALYYWKYGVNEDSETLMIFKTRTSRVDDLTNYVRSNHPYEVCKVICININNGNIPYLNCISESVPEEISQDSNIDKDAMSGK